MKNKCECYHTQQKTRYTYHPLTGSPIPHDIEVGVCWGTRETDECSCGGDEIKCDFYPEVRAKAKKELKKNSTNAANIRSMNDKKLAEFLMSRWFIDGVCTQCEGAYDRCGDFKFCESKVLEWLKKKE